MAKNEEAPKSVGERMSEERRNYYEEMKLWMGMNKTMSANELLDKFEKLITETQKDLDYMHKSNFAPDSEKIVKARGKLMALQDLIKETRGKIEKERTSK